MKIIASYSNKGGVGKTATAVNLSYALAAAGVRTLLCDLDPQGASGFYFRVNPSKKLRKTSFFDDAGKFTDAIRESDYKNLDILPANAGFRNFDVALSQMKKSRSRLGKTMKRAAGNYDVVVLDCPPNFSVLSENVFRSADRILVPIVPTTLARRAFDQLVTYFQKNDLPVTKLSAFFSMVQSVKKLHAQTIQDMTESHGELFMNARIPFASDVERMGVHRAPVMVTARSGAASLAYLSLCEETVGTVFGA